MGKGGKTAGGGRGRGRRRGGGGRRKRRRRRRRRKRKMKIEGVDRRFPQFRYESLALFWRERTNVNHEGGGIKESRELSSLPRTDTHVLSRSPGSRDERALRAPLKATPDSKPRPSPATLASGPPPSPPLSRCPLPLGISLSFSLPLARR